MRGDDKQKGWMFSCVSPEDRVPADHPLRSIRRITDRALERLSTQFDTLYINFGRPSVPPEKLLRALLLQALSSVRSERLLMEQLEYNILFRAVLAMRTFRPPLATVAPLLRTHEVQAVISRCLMTDRTFEQPPIA